MKQAIIGSCRPRACFIPAKRILSSVLSLLLAQGLLVDAQPTSRAIPHPLPNHPGNIFLAGENVVVEAPPRSVQSWRALDYEGKEIAQGHLEEDGRAHLGKLPVGYYEMRCGGDALSNRTTIGVIAPLRAPTPLNSPVAIDVAMAWFFPKERMAAPANLCALAGINWVRDRLLWPELEPKRGEFAAHTRYDDSIQTQTDAGLQVLEVDHASASWAATNTRRFPPDLRDIYQFYHDVAKRWQGKVGACEPWNEADISMFGGHTGDEMASLQKAAYFGLKAGNPEVIACQNVFAIHRAATLKNFAANQAGAYFDTFNLHCYDPLDGYPKAFADFRAVSSGKPMWATEISVHVRWQGDPQLRELSEADLHFQSERVTKTYVLALHQGTAEIFYFMLPQYTEGKIQYGLLHGDLTPRPGYVALAAVGRLLAGAKPLGRMPLPDKAGQAYFFEAKPDGKEAVVMVAWAQHESSFELPQAPKACYDHLGRPRPVEGKRLTVGTTPLYAVLSKEGLPALVRPPRHPKPFKGTPSPVVLQALLPEQDVLVKESAYKLAAGKSQQVPVFLYNFGSAKAEGRLSVTGPEGWQLSLPATAEIVPGERRQLELQLSCGNGAEKAAQEVLIRGDFGPAGKPLLALRFLPQ